jgi:hypothetical protein
MDAKTQPDAMQQNYHILVHVRKSCDPAIQDAIRDPASPAVKDKKSKRGCRHQTLAM